MPPDSTPHFRTLDAKEIERTLARNRIGRIAYAFHDHVDILPVHYVYDRGWIYGRTSPGAKLTTLRHHPWVAFEVDESDDLFAWRSVVVHGGFYQLSPEDEAWETAVRLVRTLVPETFADVDPVPFRTVLFRIAVQESTGREAVSQRAPRAARDRRAERAE